MVKKVTYFRFKSIFIRVWLKEKCNSYSPNTRILHFRRHLLTIIWIPAFSNLATFVRQTVLFMFFPFNWTKSTKRLFFRGQVWFYHQTNSLSDAFLLVLSFLSDNNEMRVQRTSKIMENCIFQRCKEIYRGLSLHKTER